MAHNATLGAGEPWQGAVEWTPGESKCYFEHNFSRFQHVQ